MAGAIITWLIKLGDWIRDLTAAGSARDQRAAGIPVQDRLGHARRAWSPFPRAMVVGDEVVVYPGEMIPVDGEIIDGTP